MRLTEEQRELYRTAFRGSYLPQWQFEQILRSEQAAWQAVELLKQALLRERENALTWDGIGTVKRIDETLAQLDRLIGGGGDAGYGDSGWESIGQDDRQRKA